MNAFNKKTDVKPLESTADLRAFLVDQMQGVATGRVSAERAKGVTNVAQQIYNSLLIEVKMAKARVDLKGEDIKSVSFK